MKRSILDICVLILFFSIDPAIGQTVSAHDSVRASSNISDSLVSGKDRKLPSVHWNPDSLDESRGSEKPYQNSTFGDSIRTVFDSLKAQLAIAPHQLRDSSTAEPQSAGLTRDTSESGSSLLQDVALPAGSTDTTTINFKNTDIRDIFRALAYQHGLNIFVDNSIDRKVTIALTGVRVYDAMAFLCQQNGLGVCRGTNIFVYKVC